MRYSIVGQRIFLLFVLNCRQIVLPLQKETLKHHFVNMKKQFYKCVNKVCAVLLTLLGFTAPITLASCYGPAPDRRLSVEELTDSTDSVSEVVVDSLMLTEDLEAVEEVFAEEDEE